MTDARSKLRFDNSAAERYVEREKAEKLRKQMAKLQPKQLAVNVAAACQIAGQEYNKGVKNGKT